VPVAVMHPTPPGSQFFHTGNDPSWWSFWRDKGKLWGIGATISGRYVHATMSTSATWRAHMAKVLHEWFMTASIYKAALIAM
jgi:hypothetical protein